MTIRAFGVVFSTTGIVMVRDLRTISIGFSSSVSMALMGLVAASKVSSWSRRVSFIVVDADIRQWRSVDHPAGFR